MSQKPFVLSVKAVVLDEASRCLVIRRSAASKQNAGLWDLPGGKCDPGEAMESALTREVAEETSLQVQLTHVVGSAQSELPDRVVAYLMVEAQTCGGEPRLSSEHDDFQWQPRHRLAELSFCPQFLEFVRSYAQSLAEPPTTTPQPPAPPQIQPRPKPRPFDSQWYKSQVDTYRQIRPRYQDMARWLITVLEQASQSLGLPCIVQARAKTIASFAEKILREGKQYPDPLQNLTDLCGARVIAHTVGGVAAICRFVEDHFEISKPDSGDKLESLGAGEFGYLSRHYVVSFRPGAFPTQTVPENLVEGGLKAEIQVRTILQHAWADINHELGYKNRFKLPRRWQREFARLAAVLEETDRDFEVIRVGLGEYASSYEAYYTEARLREEMAKLEVVCQNDPQPGIAHQLARMAISLGEWKRAIDVLEPFAAGGPAAVLRDLGVSLCKLHADDPEGLEFQRGQSVLARAVTLDPTDLDAHSSLGGTWRKRQATAADPEKAAEYREQAKACYRRAFEVDSTHPYPVGNYIEYEIADHPDVDIVSFFRPSLQAASKRCQSQAEVGVNLPWAYFDLGKFQLMLRDPYAALEFYARGVVNSTAAFYLDSALGSFPILAVAQLPGLEWSRAFLKLAQAIRFHQPPRDLLPPTKNVSPLEGPVVIVAGYCSEPATDEHRRLLEQAFEGFCGTIISGGTEAGISALVGELRAQSRDAVGYLPSQLPPDVKGDSRYKEHRHTPGADFSPLEALQYWADVYASRVPIDQVRLLAVGGGRIAASECQMALALGASVGVIEVSGSAVQRLLTELPWSNHPGLHVLRRETSAVGRFLG
jgi:mutator protein MutT